MNALATHNPTQAGPDLNVPARNHYCQHMLDSAALREDGRLANGVNCRPTARSAAGCSGEATPLHRTVRTVSVIGAALDPNQPCRALKAHRCGCSWRRPLVHWHSHDRHRLRLLLIERLFMIVKPKLLTLPWFARLWDW